MNPGSLIGSGVLVLCALAAPVQAATVSFAFNTEFSGGQAPTGPAPWVTATFSDTPTPGQVQLTVSANGLSGNEDISALYFNLNPALTPTGLTFTSLNGGTGSIAALAPISLAEDGFKADGDGLYDILLNYPIGSGPGTFTHSQTSTYDITYTGTGVLSAASFYFLSSPSGGHGPFYAAAHLQNTGTGGQSSSWLAPVASVPLPAAAWLLLSGLSGLVVLAACTGLRLPAMPGITTPA